MFRDLAVVVPCRGEPTRLNALRYEWPQGFSRYELTARNPGIGPEELAPLLRALDAALGVRLQTVWAHY